MKISTLTLLLGSLHSLTVKGKGHLGIRLKIEPIIVVLRPKDRYDRVAHKR